MPSWWHVVDVSSWTPYALESRGPRRPKLWIQDPDEGIWLRKSPPPPDPLRPHTARRSEPAIELFALELGRRAGIPVAEARPATWSGSERGIISRRFHASDEQHHPGAELLGLPSESDSSVEARRRVIEGRASATLELVRAKLKSLEQEHHVELIAPFTSVLAFDGWLGNGDRHTGNWALITGPRGARLAPMYDPTACLGVELTDDRRELTSTTDEMITWYAERCGSGFGGGLSDGRTGIPMREVLSKLAGWPEWQATISQLGPRFIALLPEVEGLLAEIPDDWLSPERKRFAARLLAHRVRLFE